jgi:hypothetical protein
MKITHLHYENNPRGFNQGHGESELHVEVEVDTEHGKERLALKRISHRSVPFSVLMRQAETEMGAAIAAKVFRGVQNG